MPLVNSQRLRRAKVLIAWFFLFGGLVGWPLSQLTLAKGEPPFTLGLSWLAIVLTAADFLSTAMVHEEQGKKDPAEEHQND